MSNPKPISAISADNPFSESRVADANAVIRSFAGSGLFFQLGGNQLFIVSGKRHRLVKLRRDGSSLGRGIQGCLVSGYQCDAVAQLFRWIRNERRRPISVWSRWGFAHGTLQILGALGYEIGDSACCILCDAPNPPDWYSMKTANGPCCQFSICDKPGEGWRSVVGYEGWYQVSNMGRVRRIKAGPRAVIGRHLGQSENRDGYLMVPLSRGSVSKSCTVHKLVGEAFIGPRPQGWYGINHKDGNKGNNLLSNLEWSSYAQNTQHAFDTGLIKNRIRGSRHHQAKINEAQAVEIRSRYLSGESPSAIACDFKLTNTTVCDIGNGKIWRHL
jgi:hypothetical protein